MNSNLILEVIFGLLIGGFISVILYVLKEYSASKVDMMFGNDKVISILAIDTLDTIKRILDTNNIHTYIKHKLSTVEGLDITLSNKIFLSLDRKSLNIIRTYLSKRLDVNAKRKHRFVDCFVLKNNNKGDIVILVEIYLYLNYRIYKTPMIIRINKKTGDFLIELKEPRIKLENSNFVTLKEVDLSAPAFCPTILPELDRPLNGILNIEYTEAVKDGE